MTVAEFIRELGDAPQDAEVLFFVEHRNPLTFQSITWPSDCELISVNLEYEQE